jgi:hypothetical protein
LTEEDDSPYGLIPVKSMAHRKVLIINILLIIRPNLNRGANLYR